jgi:hypothetical protein
MTLVMAAMVYALPKVAGIDFHGDWGGALASSLVFNLVFLGLEWVLGILVFGINIGTLGLGLFITNALRWLSGLLLPSFALFGTCQVMPQFVHVTNYFPSAIIGGLILGGLLWAGLPTKKKGS